MKDGAETLDTPELRKSRGAFFTPKPIADYLARWAIEDDPAATVLDPTCGEAVFLESAGERLRDLGVSQDAIREQVLGVDLHERSVRESERLLRDGGLDGSFIAQDFFALETPEKLDARLPYVDAVIGNPPFVRYQNHVGLDRKRAQRAALEQGVRLSGLASSWAALLVHSCGFLKPEGRLAMVLPAELLSVGYAEPIRAWLKDRFKAVHLVMFDRLQFTDALAKVVLVLARGSGGCNAFSLVPVRDAEDLPGIRMFGPMHLTVAPSGERKWSDFRLPVGQRQLFDRVTAEHFTALGDYGAPSLGTVTGANSFFCINEQTRKGFEIAERHLVPTCPPGTRHLPGIEFKPADWEVLRDAGAATWMLQPADDAPTDRGIARYLAEGEHRGVPAAYKCRKRKLWFRPPMAPAPDLFFTYMSHWAPRLIENAAAMTFVNSMHGIRLRDRDPEIRAALPLLALNSLTMVGGEVFGRSYGGGVLKMEPREAAALPVPKRDLLREGWRRLRTEKHDLDQALREGKWTAVVEHVDQALLEGAAGLSREQIAQLADAAASLRRARLGTP
jgi:adenine-specific DNA-methyltransferase